MYLAALTPAEHFEITITILAAGFSVVGGIVIFSFQRYMGKNDERWGKVDKLILSDQVDANEKPTFLRRLERMEELLIRQLEMNAGQAERNKRTDDSISKLATIVTEQGVQIARLEGIQGRKD